MADSLYRIGMCCKVLRSAPASPKPSRTQNNTAHEEAGEDDRFLQTGLATSERAEPPS